jgi:hypothetical protein
MKKLCMGIALGLMAVAGTASAQPGVEVPAGVTTDRAGTEREMATLDVGFVNYDGFSNLAYAARVDFYGQLLGRAGAHRAGFYLALPYARIETSFGDDAMSSLGNLELGGLLVIRRSANTDVVLRGGFVLALEHRYDGEGENWDIMVPMMTGYGRVTDYMTTYPGLSWLRASGSVLHRQAPYFVRADLGVDVPEEDMLSSSGPFTRLNVAAGVELGPVAVLGELANLAAINEAFPENVVSTFALTARRRSSTFSPCVGLVFPIDDELQNFVDLVFVVGIRAGDPG